MKYQEFQKNINKPFFSTQDIHVRRISFYPSQLSLWKKKGYIGTLKRGLYYFVQQKELITPQEVSFLLYEPSYLSLEWALSYYGIMPDITHSITAITTKRTRNLSNAYGKFIYRNLKPELFFGYLPHTTTHGKYLLAEPEKALLDYLYLNLGHLDNETDVDDLRINYPELAEMISKKKVEEYLAVFQSKKLQRITNIILQQC